MIRAAAIVRYEASVYHNNNSSIPASLFEELCAVGETPSALWQEFNEDAGVNIPLLPLKG